MLTNFTPRQLEDPATRESSGILRNCVQCGFCLPACPTHAEVGDELDSPRGRIFLIQHMLESGGPPPPETVRHIDRCLSCLGCAAACPSGVDYGHLVDHARVHIETHYRRPLADRLFRRLVSFVLPRPRLFRLALLLARPAALMSALLPRRLRGMVESLPARVDPPSPTSAPQVFAAEGGIARKRVAMLTGCAQQVLGTRINEATIRILRRHGCEVVVAAGTGCCGALTHHMGREAEARAAARANLAAWGREFDGQGLDAIVINASGCGTTVKDYGHLFANDPAWRDTAARIAGLAVDVSELLVELGVRADAAPAGAPVVAYHDACSLQHGQKLSAPPRALLAASGFDVREVAEGHMCCGAAGTYTLLQPDLSGRLGRRKAANVRATGAAVAAAGNLGCLLHLERFGGLQALHTVELLDWATGGPRPRALSAD